MFKTCTVDSNKISIKMFVSETNFYIIRMAGSFPELFSLFLMLSNLFLRNLWQDFGDCNRNNILFSRYLYLHIGTQLVLVYT